MREGKFQFWQRQALVETVAASRAQVALQALQPLVWEPLEVVVLQQKLVPLLLAKVPARKEELSAPPPKPSRHRPMKARLV